MNQIFYIVWEKFRKSRSENYVTNKSKISDEVSVFEYRAPKDQNKNHDESPIRLETPLFERSLFLAYPNFPQRKFWDAILNESYGFLLYNKDE